MKRQAPIAVLLLLLMTAPPEPAYARRHHHYHHHGHHYNLLRRGGGGDQTPDFDFCQSVRDAFLNLGVKELSRFVAALPRSRKEEADQCLN
jgi:hypothetical protein